MLSVREAVPVPEEPEMMTRDDKIRLFAVLGVFALVGIAMIAQAVLP